MIRVSLMQNPRLSHVVFGVLAGLTMTLAGCGDRARRGKIQVQFYSPGGAAMVVRGVGGEEVVPIRSRGPVGDRLEHGSDKLAVFDLSPGRYALAYAGAPGAEEAVIYGELELRGGQQAVTRRLCRHSFIPIKLPSLQAQGAEHRFPTRDLSYTVGLEGREFEHIKQGDMISKVYFVADLAKVRREHEVGYREQIAEVDRKLAVLADEELYVETRYRDERRRALQRDPEMNIGDKIAHDRYDRWGTQERFIKLAQRKQELAAERERLMTERKALYEQSARRNALLRSLKIIHRDGALVLATPDLQLPYSNTVDQVCELGEVVAVLHVGGRHRYWAEDLLASRWEEAAVEAETELERETAP